MEKRRKAHIYKDMSAEEEVAIKKVQTAANGLRKVNLTAFLASGGTLHIYRGNIPENETGAMDQDAAIASVGTDWDGGGFLTWKRKQLK